MSAQLGAVGFVGSEYTGRKARWQLPHRTHCSAFWNPQHQSFGSSAGLLNQLSKGLRGRIPRMAGEDRRSSKIAFPFVACCLLTSRAPCIEASMAEATASQPPVGVRGSAQSPSDALGSQCVAEKGTFRWQTYGRYRNQYWGLCAYIRMHTSSYKGSLTKNQNHSLPIKTQMFWLVEIFVLPIPNNHPSWRSFG